jgi:hypothetical protein
VNHCVATVSLVVDAFVEEAVSKMEVEEAMREIGEPVRYRAVVVPETPCPYCVDGVKGYEAPGAVKLHVPAAYEQLTPEEQELVEVATPVHAPPENARTCPLVPAKSEVVEMAVGAAEAPVWFASTVFAAMFAICVSASVPEIVPSVEVAPEYSLPLLSIPTPPVPPTSPVNHVAPELEKSVVEALLKSAVEEAKSE